MSVIVLRHEITLLREWILNINVLEEMHRKSYLHFKKINYFLMIPIIIFTGMSGAIGFANIDKHEKSANYFDVWSLINGILGLTAAILTTVYNFMTVPELQQDHHIHYKEYNKLSREITTELILSNTDDRTYANLGEFIKICRTRLDRLRDSSPQIPDFIYNDSTLVSQKNTDNSDNEKKDTSYNNINNNTDNNHIDIDINEINHNDNISNNMETFRIYMKENT